ncbi:hypothetical protein GCM10028787_05740 [Brachybacterium horti]
MTPRLLPLRRLTCGAAALALGAALTPALTAPALAAPLLPPGDLQISEVYGGGGNSGATYTHDFVELRNTSDAAISLDGWSLQYASKTGAFSAGNTLKLSGSVPAGGTFLVQLAQGNGGTEALPTPDLTGSLALAGTGGVVALSNASGALTCQFETCAGEKAVVDLLGWGGAATYAGTAPAAATTNATSASRTAETGDNAADFTAGAPTPQPSGSETDPTDPTDPTEPTDPVEPGAVVPIAEIQGTGAASPLAGTTVTTEGVVTAVYATGGLNGFVIQTGGTGGDIDPATAEASQGLFVHSPATVGDVEIGQGVKVTGQVSEYYDATQISVAAGGLTTPDAELAPVEPAVLTGGFPTDPEQRERLESMLILPAEGDLTVTDVYETNKYGEVGLAIGDQAYRQPAETLRPGAEATALYQQQLEDMILLDDGKTTNFSTATDVPMSYLSTEEPVRVGAGVGFEEPVVLSYSFDAWRLQPTTPWESSATDGISFEDTRQATPDEVGGDLQVGTFNVLNYFTTLGEDTPGCEPYTDRAGEGTSVRGGCDPRGAWGQDDLDRQQSKIVDAISTSGLDVVGLMEIENSARLGEEADEATATLVAALNEEDGAGTWAYVPTAAAYEAAGSDAGQDVIASALIYKPAAAAPQGDAVVLAGDPAFSNAREPLGQVFAPVGQDSKGRAVQGEPFFFAVNHFKSKGSKDAADASLPADPVQGNSRTSRLAQANALNAWVQEQQEALGVEDVLLGGDFNAYTQEDPLQVFYEAGYTDLGSTFDEDGWSYSFDGMTGSLDHVLANDSARERITGATDWSINGAESPLALYSRANTNVTELYQEGPFASSDHNPMITGLDAEFAPASGGGNGNGNGNGHGKGRDNDNKGPGKNNGTPGGSNSGIGKGKGRQG